MMVRRAVGFTDSTHLAVQDCYSQIQGTARAVNNDYLIPYMIIGYKS